MLKKLFSPKMQGQLRHLLSTLAGVAASYGVFTDAQGLAIVGLVMAALAFGWSWFDPTKKVAL